MRFELRGFGIDVVLLEPGLITTEFAGAATNAMTRATSETDEGPYARFNAAVGAITTGAYAGPMRRLGAGPDRVAKVIEKAISSRRPPARIRITPSARLTIAARRLLSDRAWDALMRRQFPEPG
jgi:NAD(P)-dependent dehydrogenase (short-subunit alcohol dehydrogenase family)